MTQENENMVNFWVQNAKEVTINRVLEIIDHYMDKVANGVYGGLDGFERAYMDVKKLSEERR